MAQPLRQRRIGLTGGIASGKSTVAQLLEQQFNLPVLDADRYAREALAPGTPGARAVLERYGDTVRRARGAGSAGEGPEIDRAALARIVFSNAAERRWLEALVHPLVRARFASQLERLRREPVVVLMIPLLYEAGLEGLCSEIWVVSCDEQDQLRRLLQRDGGGEAEARARIAAQWPLERKRLLADVVIDNQTTPAQLANQVAEHLGDAMP